MSLKIEYPKPLPELVSKNIQLETGFYLTEVVALQKGWSLIKQCLVRHARKISVNFFSKYFLLLEKFRNVETEKLDLTSLHQHTYQMMNSYECLIECGLKDVAYVNMLLSEVESRHKLLGIEKNNIKLIANYIEQYLLDFLCKVKSTTFQNGLSKLSQLIIDHHGEETKEKEEDASFSDKQND